MSRNSDCENLASIVVTTYKNFSCLPKLVQTIFAQTWPKLEVIISDDGSANFSKEFFNGILSNPPAKIKKIKLIHHERNLGTVKNFNHAIKSASGKFIIGIAQDDHFFSSDTVASIIERFGDSHILACKRALMDLTGNPARELPTAKQIKLLRKRNLYKHLLARGNFISGACTYYRRDVFDKYGFFDENFRLLEDFPFYLHYLRKGGIIKFADLVTVLYSPDGISTQFLENPALQSDILNLYRRELAFNQGALRKIIWLNLVLRKIVFKINEENKTLSGLIKRIYDRFFV